MELFVYLWYLLLFGWLFVLGCAVGSFLNVVVYRVPRRKNLLWPSSRCGRCFTPIPLYHNVPLVSYWRLRGRCGTCRAPFSMRYFWIELATGVLFAGLYALEVGLNAQGYSVWPEGGFYYLSSGTFPPHSWPLLAGHGIVAALLLVAAICLLDSGNIPRSAIAFGAVTGLAWSILYPWPTPEPAYASANAECGFALAPVWPPLTGWEGSFALGAATGLAGLLVVPWLVRGVARLTGRDLSHVAGLLLMTGGFLGWQASLAALVLACGLTPLAGLLTNRWTYSHPLPLSLIVALVGVWLGWRWLGATILPWLNEPLWALAALVGASATLAVVARLCACDGPVGEL